MSKIKWNRNGIQELLSSPAMQGLVAAEARKVHDALAEPDGYEVDVEVTSTPHSKSGLKRANAYVFTKTYAARRREAQRQYLRAALRRQEGG